VVPAWYSGRQHQHSNQDVISAFEEGESAWTSLVKGAGNHLLSGLHYPTRSRVVASLHELLPTSDVFVLGVDTRKYDLSVNLSNIAVDGRIRARTRTQIAINHRNRPVIAEDGQYVS
jgi:hypothetical protein